MLHLNYHRKVLLSKVILDSIVAFSVPNCHFGVYSAFSSIISSSDTLKYKAWYPTLKKIKDSFCETPISIAYQIRVLWKV